jgi:hypothetical protein
MHDPLGSLDQVVQGNIFFCDFHRLGFELLQVTPTFFEELLKSQEA